MIAALGALLLAACGGISARADSLDPYPPPAQAGGSSYEIVEPLLDVDVDDSFTPPKDLSTKQSSSWEYMENPDRYPSLQLLQNGLETVNGHAEALTETSPPTTRTERSYVVDNILTAILPVSDAWTVTAGGGLSLSESDAYGTSANNERTGDNSVAQYVLGGRYYFIGAQGPWETIENPDRWPSIGLQASGSTTVQYDPDTGVVQPNGTAISQAFSTKAWRFDNENRIPLSDWYTMIVILSGVYTRNYSPYVPNLLTGSLEHVESLGATLQQNFYFVGHNLIRNDQGLNPDRWTSLYFAFGGLGSVSFRDTELGKLGVPSDRNDNSSSINAALGVRLPVTAHATLRLELDYDYTDNSSPVLDTFGGGHTVLTELGALAGVRLYLF